MFFEILVKTLILTVWVIIIRGTLPRYRLDTFHISTWKTWIFLLLLFFIYDLIITIFFQL